MSLIPRMAFLLELFRFASSQGGSTVSTGTCHARDAGDCIEAVSEADVDTADDAHAAAIRVSLMQKEHLQLQRSKQEKIAKKGRQEIRRNTTTRNDTIFPADLVSCAGESVLQTQQMSLDDYDEVVDAMHQIWMSLDTKCDESGCMQADWAGCVVNFAMHDVMDFRDNSGGGSDACLDFADPSNAGLLSCFNGTANFIGLAQAYSDFCSRMSLADFVVIAAEAVMSITRESVLTADGARKQIDFRSQFKFGRVTSERCMSTLDRIPDPAGGCRATQSSLVDGLGLTWNQTAALMGVHTLGSLSLEHPGYEGRWTSAESSRMFDNGYYVSLVLSGWGPVYGLKGDDDRAQWLRVDLGANKDKGLEAMLDSDMCLYHYMFDDLVENEDLYLQAHLNARSAEAQGCKCAWTRVEDFYPAMEKYNNNEFCGSPVYYPRLADLGFGTTGHIGLESENTLQFAKQRMSCCTIRPPNQQIMASEPQIDCGLPSKPLGKAAAAIKLFANYEEVWIDSFLEAWGIATTKTHAQLYSTR